MGRVVKKPEERKREILTTAAELFQQYGYEQVTMQMIMQQLNIAKGTIYHYFSSKEALMEGVVESLVDTEMDRKTSLLSSPQFRDLSAVEKVRLLLSTDTMASDHQELLEQLHTETMDRVHMRQLGSYISKLAPLYAEVIQQGREEGSFTTDHPLESAELLLAGLQYLTDLGFFPWTEQQLVRRAAAVPRLLEQQLGAAEGTFSFLSDAT